MDTNEPSLEISPILIEKFHKFNSPSDDNQCEFVRKTNKKRCTNLCTQDSHYCSKHKYLMKNRTPSPVRKLSIANDKLIEFKNQQDEEIRKISIVMKNMKETYG